MRLNVQFPVFLIISVVQTATIPLNVLSTRKSNNPTNKWGRTFNDIILCVRLIWHWYGLLRKYYCVLFELKADEFGLWNSWDYVCICLWIGLLINPLYLEQSLLDFCMHTSAFRKFGKKLFDCIKRYEW